jgi:hypothetical protein
VSISAPTSIGVNAASGAGGTLTITNGGATIVAGSFVCVAGCTNALDVITAADSDAVNVYTPNAAVDSGAGSVRLRVLYAGLVTDDIENGDIITMSYSTGPNRRTLVGAFWTATLGFDTGSLINGRTAFASVAADTNPDGTTGALGAGNYVAICGIGAQQPNSAGADNWSVAGPFAKVNSAIIGSATANRMVGLASAENQAGGGTISVDGTFGVAENWAGDIFAVKENAAPAGGTPQRTLMGVGT